MVSFLIRNLWFTNFASKVADLKCNHGPKMCGESNFLQESGIQCGHCEGCAAGIGGFSYEQCLTVSETTCLKECPEG